MVMVKTEQHRQTKPAPTISSSLSSSSSSSSSSRKIKKFKGVRMRTWGSWVSEIRAPNQKTRIWLGSYSTAEAAARAYDAALLCLKGSSAAANLNFPISLYSHIPDDTTMSPKTIQRVAAAAANASPSPTATSPSPASSPSPSVQSYSPEECLYEEFNWCNNLDALKYVDDRTFSEDYNLLMLDQTAVFDYSYEEAGDIRLWSFC